MTRIIHVFDREGDIAEVFDEVRQMERTGVVVRAAHDRSLDSAPAYLWGHLSNQLIQFYQEVELVTTTKRAARTAKLAVRFSPVQLRSPKRFNNQDPLKVYAVYALEIDPPEGEEAVSWMLLTTLASDYRERCRHRFAVVHLPLACGRISQNFEIRKAC